MKDRRLFRMMMIVICFIGAGLNGYKIIEGEHSTLDIFLLFVFLAFAGIYIYQLRKNQAK